MNKEEAIKLIEKVKISMQLMNEVDKEIKTCNQRFWQIYDENVFFELCEVLERSYSKSSIGKNIYFSVIYDGIEICSCKLSGE